MTSHGEQNIAKKELPVFTCNGTFYRRNNVSLLQYSSFIAIDFGGFSSYTKLQAYKEHLKTYPYVYAVFVSPSGVGLKAIIQHTSTNPHHHYNLFVQLHRIFGMNNSNFDGVVSDISRGTYFSYDPDLWQNPYCKPFEFVYDLGIGDKKDKGASGKKPVTTTASYHYETSDADRLMNSIFQGTMTDKQVINYMNNHFWKQKEDYQEGNRQSSLLRKAARLCKYGVLYENALEELKYRYCYAGLEEEEVEEEDVMEIQFYTKEELQSLSDEDLKALLDQYYEGYDFSNYVRANAIADILEAQEEVMNEAEENN